MDILCGLDLDFIVQIFFILNQNGWELVDLHQMSIIKMLIQQEIEF